MGLARQGARRPDVARSTPRIRVLTKDQAQQLIAALPEHLADLTISLSTGLRSANAARITLPQIDLERRFAWIYLDQAKHEGRSRFRSTVRHLRW